MRLFLGLLFLFSVDIQAETTSEVFQKGLEEIDKRITEKQENDQLNAEMQAISELKNYKKANLSPGVFLVYNPIKNSFSAEEISKMKYPKALDLFKVTFPKMSFATGFLYKDYIVTNYHACRGQNTIIRDYEGEIFSVKMLIYDPNQDICILKSDKIHKKSYPNFANIKIKPIIKEEKKQNIHREIASKLYEKEPSEKNKLEKEKTFYASIFSMWGEFVLTNIREDLKKDDEWVKEKAYIARGDKCKGGISGSPVVGTKGLIGIAWGAIESGQVERECFFIDKSEIDRVISQIP